MMYPSLKPRHYVKFEYVSCLVRHDKGDWYPNLFNRPIWSIRTSEQPKKMSTAPTCNEIRSVVLAWLQEWPINNAARVILGKKSDTTIGVRQATTESAYSLLAAHVNDHFGLGWDRKRATNFWQNWLKAYKSTAKWKSSTGAGVDAPDGGDLAAHLVTKCHGFFQLDELLGGKENIQPSVRLIAGKLKFVISAYSVTFLICRLPARRKCRSQSCSPESHE